MKISSLQENLKSGLNIVSHIAGKNVNLPILNNILIEAKGGNIKMITTDLEIGVVCLVRGKIKEEGSFTVESKVISDYISLLPNQKVDMEVKDKKIKIKSNNYKTVIRGQVADEFPLIPKIDKKNYYKAKIESFKKALSQVVFAVSTSETRLELSGVLFNFKNKELTLAATDSYRLAEKSVKINSNSEKEEQIIIPAKTLQELLRIIGLAKTEDVRDNDSEITFYVSDDQVMFTVGTTELISRLIEGQYPNYKQIIPISKKTNVVASREELIRAVKAASIFSKTGINDVNLDFPSGKKKIIVSSASGQTGENISEIDAVVDGKDNGIVVNYRYFLDGLNHISNDNVVIELTNGDTPCVLKAENNNEYLYIIMPIKQ